MKATDIIGWNADADCYCDACASVRYGPARPDRLDREGNEVHPIFGYHIPDIAASGGCTCSDCGEVIVE